MVDTVEHCEMPEKYSMKDTQGEEQESMMLQLDLCSFHLMNYILQQARNERVGFP